MDNLQLSPVGNELLTNAAAELEALRSKLNERTEVLRDWSNSYHCVMTHFDSQVPRLIELTDAALSPEQEGVEPIGENPKQ